jgi:regulatory protein
MAQAEMQGTLLHLVPDTSDADTDLRKAMERAGRFLALRPRTEHEVRARLAELDTDADVIESTVERLVDLKLVDDLAFATQWIAERSARKGLGPNALIHELRGKGVAGDVIHDALAEAGLDEEAAAVELAAKLVRKVAAKPLVEQGPRLHAMLVAKGHSHEAAEAAVRAVLPPEGWD